MSASVYPLVVGLRILFIRELCELVGELATELVVRELTELWSFFIVDRDPDIEHRVPPCVDLSARPLVRTLGT